VVEVEVVEAAVVVVVGVTVVVVEPTVVVVGVSVVVVDASVEVVVVEAVVVVVSLATFAQPKPTNRKHETRNKTTHEQNTIFFIFFPPLIACNYSMRFNI